MIWIATGNKRLDGHIRALMNFNSELDTPACMNSPLTSSDIETLRKRIKSINTLLNKVAKRKK